MFSWSGEERQRLFLSRLRDEPFQDPASTGKKGRL